MADATKITATGAAHRFSELLNRVRIEPSGAARVAAVADLLEVLGSGPARDQGFADDLEQAQRRQPRPPESPWVA